MAINRTNLSRPSVMNLLTADLNEMEASSAQMKSELFAYLRQYGDSADAMQVMLFLEPMIQQHVVMDKAFLTHVMDEQFVTDVDDVLDRLRKLLVLQDDDFVTEMVEDSARQIVDYIIRACRTAKMCLEKDDSMPKDDAVFKQSVSVRGLLAAGLLDPQLFDDEKGKKEV